MDAGDRYLKVVDEIKEECEKCGRSPEDVCLVCVSKTVGPEQVGEVIAKGGKNFGENRPDELDLESSAHPDVNWHFIGNIQSRR
ncbi:MAG: YggS family pyridoxal phosphate-dependent enzyme, partial [Eggerthellaceae bacterium]|nr:YggS family pyridoxal phosphate-dependent enzyme [Eggerthellaceae bacterium]